MAETAAILVIGNEILTGKVEDRNVAYLAGELFALGVSLRRVVVCPDVVDVIAEEVRALRASHDVVLTTGGVGPTHDDVTIAAIARAFGRAVVRDASMESMLRAHYRERLTEGHLRMADVPEGAELLRSAEVPWPTVSVGNVIVFPGVPELVRLKFPALRDRLRSAGAFVSRAVFTKCDEGEIAAVLDRVVAAHPNVVIGSYPQWQREGYRTKLTFDGRDPAAVAAAADDFAAGIGAENVVTPPGG
jgi:molybdenum cofactor synthesis domain-containing protein